MDFHRLSRRQLQSLCKLNKIPANITNLAMADALHSLHFVEGMEEELLKATAESVTTAAESSIDSPERNTVNSSFNVPPPTGRRSTTRRKLAAGGDSSVQAMKSRTTSSRRTISEEMTQEAEVQKTPAVARSTRKKKDEVGVTSAMQRVYSTRRSTRLSEKKKAVDKDKEKKEVMMNKAITIDLGEIVEEHFSEVCDNNITFSGNGSQTVVQESGNESGFMGSQIAGDVNHDEVNKPNAKTEETLEALDELNVGQADNSHSLVIENDEHYEDSKEVVKDSDVQEETGDDHEEKADMITEEKVDMITEEKAATDMKPDSFESEETKEEINTDERDTEPDVLTTEVSSSDQDAEVDTEGEKESTMSEVLNCCDPKENAVQPDINSIGSSNALDSENPVDKEIGSEAAAPVEEKAADIKPEAIDSEVEVSPMKTEKTLEHLKSEAVGDDAEADSDVKKFDELKENVVEPETDSTDSSGKMSPVDSVTAFCANDANETKPAGGEHLSKTPEPVKGNAFASILADDQLPNHVASPIRLTPLKKSSTKTPTMKRLNHFGDDKENIDHSGVTSELAKEKAKTNKKENALTGKQKEDGLNEKSLRELTKMLKEKLQISNNSTTSEEAKDEMLTTAKVAKAERPALQKLSENCLIASNNEN